MTNPVGIVTDRAPFARLAALPPADYGRVREAEASKLGIPPSRLDAAIYAARPKPERKRRRILTALHDPEPWPGPVALPELLDRLHGAIRRHVAMSEDEATAVALWIAHTWVYGRFQHTPRLAIVSPATRCGKSTLIEFLRMLSSRPLKADAIPANRTFHIIGALAPLTLLFDDANAWLGKNEELRGLLRFGFERSAQVIRAIGPEDQCWPLAYPAFCPVALAAIGDLPPTLEHRAIVIRLARKTAAEPTERLGEPGPRAALTRLAARLSRWASDEAAALGAGPAIPPALHDRQADIARPLLAIAEAAGEQWAERARQALISLFGADSDDPGSEHGARLLADIRAVMLGNSATRMPSADLCRHLAAMEDRPWPQWRAGRPMTPMQLALALRPFGVRPVKFRAPAGKPAQGYYREAFAEAWDRYLARPAPEAVEQWDLAAEPACSGTQPRCSR